MTHTQIGRINQQSKGETPLVRGVLQRAAVRAVAQKEGEATQEVESGGLNPSRFVHDFSQMPIGREGLPKEVSKTPNQTGLPDNLKAGVENLSGYSLDDVRVHYNSPKPTQLQALAYTKGTEIHVAPGQEKHLPHEAWHVVQQMQGRVKPTKEIKGIQINEEERLEAEAEVEGERSTKRSHYGQFGREKVIPARTKQTGERVIQKVKMQKKDLQPYLLQEKNGWLIIKGFTQKCHITLYPYSVKGQPQAIEFKYFHASRYQGTECTGKVYKAENKDGTWGENITEAVKTVPDHYNEAKNNAGKFESWVKSKKLKSS